jgi:ABC-2 type transport system permease protein
MRNVRKTLKAGLSLFRIRVAEGLQYRIAALSGATISIFWGLIEVVVLTVFFTYGNKTGDNINGMTLAQGISYIWLAQFMVGFLGSTIDGDLLGKITSGDIGVELCRPLDLYWHWFARTAAGKVAAVSVRGSLTLAFGATLSLIGFYSIGLGLPHAPLNFILFLISIFNALLFSTAYSMFMASIRIGLSWGDGPIHLIGVTGMVLSGTHLPLQIWPDFMQAFLRVQPFAGYLDTPARLYVGSVTIENGLISIAFQFIWIIAFIIFGRIIMKRKIKGVVVQGG